MKQNLEELAGHFDGVTRDDLLVIAFHDGVAHSVTVKDAGFEAVNLSLTLALRDQVLWGEARSQELLTERYK